MDELDCEYGDDPRFVNVLVQCLAGQWFYSVPVSPPVDAGVPIGDAGCPTTYAAAQSATFCDTPSCVYPEGTCTCEVAMGNDSGTLWACTVPALPTGCPGTIAEAQSSVTCPSYALRCLYPGGTCTCFTVDAGAPGRCTVPEAGCPATRPRLGTTCDAALAEHCTYIPVGAGPVVPLPALLFDVIDGHVGAEAGASRSHGGDAREGRAREDLGVERHEG